MNNYRNLCIYNERIIGNNSSVKFIADIMKRFLRVVIVTSPNIIFIRLINVKKTEINGAR